MARRVILHEDEVRIEPYICMCDRNSAFGVGFSGYTAPIFLPENAWTFGVTMEAAPEHPTTWSTVPIDYTGVI